MGEIPHVGSGIFTAYHGPDNKYALHYMGYSIRQYRSDAHPRITEIPVKEFDTREEASRACAMLNYAYYLGYDNSREEIRGKLGL